MNAFGKYFIKKKPKKAACAVSWFGKDPMLSSCDLKSNYLVPFAGLSPSIWPVGFGGNGL